jgi:hypothetical protein
MSEKGDEHRRTGSGAETLAYPFRPDVRFQFRVNCTHYRAAALLSASPLIPAINISRMDCCSVPILLQKSFSTADQNFSRPLVRFSDKYVKGPRLLPACVDHATVDRRPPGSASPFQKHQHPAHCHARPPNDEPSYPATIRFVRQSEPRRPTPKMKIP